MPFDDDALEVDGLTFVWNRAKALSNRRKHAPTLAAAADREEDEMHMKLLLAAIAAIVLGLGAGVARADAPPHELAGQPFYFAGSCTGLGDVIVVNQSLAHTGSVRVVGTQTVIVLGKRGIELHANGECSFTGGGFSVETIEPFDEPFTVPVHIAGA